MGNTSRNCGSCGMPFKKDPNGGGTNSDGSQNLEYCSYCYQNGKFTFEGTSKEFQEHCKQKMIEGGHSKFIAWLFTRWMDKLPRWNKN
jgi:hypothetical protein